MPRVVIDSKFRTNGTAERYTFRMFSPLKDVRDIRLIGAQVPKTMFNIVAGWNDLISATYIGGPFLANVSPGAYTGDQLASELNIAMAAAVPPGPATWTYDISRNRLTVVLTAAFIINANGASGPHAGQTYGWPPEGIVFGGAGTFEMENQVDLSYPRSLYCNVTLGNWQGQDVWTATNSHSFYLPFATVDFGEIENYAVESFYPQASRPTNVNSQEFQIEWRGPEPDYPFSFHGIDHQLVFDIQTV